MRNAVRRTSPKPDRKRWLRAEGEASATARPSLCEEASEPDGSRPQGPNKKLEPWNAFTGGVEATRRTRETRDATTRTSDAAGRTRSPAP